MVLYRLVACIILLTKNCNFVPAVLSQTIDLLLLHMDFQYNFKSQQAFKDILKPSTIEIQFSFHKVMISVLSSFIPLTFSHQMFRLLPSSHKSELHSEKHAWRNQNVFPQLSPSCECLKFAPTYLSWTH